MSAPDDAKWLFLADLVLQPWQGDVLIKEAGWVRDRGEMTQDAYDMVVVVIRNHVQMVGS